MRTSAIIDVDGFERGLFSYPLKYRFIFLVLVATGFRISDVLNLKVRDVRRGKSITEKKTKKRRQFSISADLQAALMGYAKTCGLRGEDFLFPSTKGNLCRPVSRHQVHRVFKAVGASLGLVGIISPHSCRRTYARLKIESGASVDDLQLDFNHSSRKITEGYLDE